MQAKELIEGEDDIVATSKAKDHLGWFLAILAGLSIAASFATLATSEDQTFKRIDILITLATAWVVLWYTMEAYRLRRNAEKQLKLAQMERERLLTPQFELTGGGRPSNDSRDVGMYLRNLGGIVTEVSVEGHDATCYRTALPDSNTTEGYKITLKSIHEPQKSLRFAINYRRLDGKRDTRHGLWTKVNDKVKLTIEEDN